MDQFAPLFVDLNLPDRVILRDEHAVNASAPSRHPNDADAIWYRGHASAMVRDKSGAILVWNAENNLGTPARRAEPNEGHARLASGGGVTYIREVNGGFVVEAALVEAEKFCCAVRLASQEGQARSLITVNPSKGGNYLFLSEKDGLIEWRDDEGTAEVSMKSPGAEFWVLAGYDHGKLSLSAAKTGAKFPLPQTSIATSQPLAAALSGPSDLFVGCRSHRKGILKTLGASTLLDVLVWIDQSCTAPDEMDKITQACRYAEGPGDGA